MFFYGIRNAVRPTTPGGRFPLVILIFFIAKVQKILETTKYFLNFFRKKYTKGTVPFVYNQQQIQQLQSDLKQSPGMSDDELRRIRGILERAKQELL